MTEVVDQMMGERPDRVAAEPASVHDGVEEDVD
jgi:hypothetical protein